MMGILQAKSGMAQMFEKMIPPEVMEGIEKAKTEIPIFAENLKNQVIRIEESLKRIEESQDLILELLSNSEIKNEDSNG